MPTILETYYRGITQQICGEVEFINSIFHHQGMKGEGNEIILRDLIKKFIPKRYGVGTGVVIDRNGAQSKQVDIVIYDQIFYPSILSLSSVHLFPVDIVYATIEIKTTLDSSEADKALKNIFSVQDLELIPDNYSMWESQPNGGAGLVTYKPIPPFGFIFAYRSNVIEFETFKNWFVSAADQQKSNLMIGCLDQGLILMPTGQAPSGRAFPVYERDKPEQSVFILKYAKFHTYEGVEYPVKEVQDCNVLIDPSKVLLNFIFLLSDLLTMKKINPNLKLTESYFKDSTHRHIPV